MSSLITTVRLDDTFGAVYIGAMVMMVLYGVTCLQTYLIFVRYPRDTALNKCLVLSLWIMDTFHVCLVALAIYHYLITNYANPSALVDGTWSLYLSLGMNVLIAFAVQCFFTLRIHNLSGKNWWITSPLIICVILHLAFGIETMGELFRLRRLDSLSKITYIAALPFAAFAVLSDIVITVALCWLLHTNKSKFKQTNILINYLILYAINRCLLTTAMAVVEVVLFVVLPGSLWFLAVDFIIGKCYANSLLATLNSRASLRSKGADVEASTMRFSSVMGIQHTQHAHGGGGSRPGGGATTSESESESGSRSPTGSARASEGMSRSGSETEKLTSRHTSLLAAFPPPPSVEPGRRRLSAPPGLASVSDEMDGSEEMQKDAASIKEEQDMSFVLIRSPSRGSLEMDVDEFFSIHETEAL